MLLRPVADKLPLLDLRSHVLCSDVDAVLLAVLLVVTLSAQTLAHRRNVLFAFSLIVLAKMFNVNISDTLSLRVTETVEASRLDQLAMGLLVAFLFYSFVEYAFTFLSDYLRTERSRTTQTAAGLMQTVATPLVGVYRIVFDILLPSLALLFAIYAYGDEGKKFAEAAIDTLRDDYERIVVLTDEDKERITQALKKIQETCPECIDAIADIRRRRNE